MLEISFNSDHDINVLLWSNSNIFSVTMYSGRVVFSLGIFAFFLVFRLLLSRKLLNSGNLDLSCMSSSFPLLGQIVKKQNKVNRRSSHKPSLPHTFFSINSFCAEKTSLWDIFVGEYSKLEDNKASGFF